ncbi:MAG: MmgE/PrpD family protein [Chloroflexi bacterium]|nr:MmgE/PrpD family protein [Chloroflexota bacterium]
MTIAGELARFACELEFKDLPQDVITRTKQFILDSLGVQLGASVRPWSKIVYRYTKRRAGGLHESTIANYGDKVCAEDAAFANASFAHGLEYDDTHRGSSTHVTCVVVPSAMAVGEREVADGRELVLAVVLGIDVMARVGASVWPNSSLQGFHPTPVCGPFGAAVAAGKLLRLNPDTLTNALSIAGSHSCGFQEFTQTGGSAKRMHAGIAAHGGIRATLLAQDGLTGPPAVFEGDMGFCKLFSWGQYHLDRITADLGKRFEVMELAYKLYCQDYKMQSITDAFSMILKNHPAKAENLEKVTVRTTQHGFNQFTKIPWPREVTEAHWCGPFSLALRLVKGGCGPDQYVEENLNDPMIREVANRIEFIADKELTDMSVNKQLRPAIVSVKIRDGSTHKQRVDAARGTPENPAPPEEIEDKFRSLARMAISQGNAEEIIRMVRDLETLRDVSTLGGLMSRQ